MHEVGEGREPASQPAATTETDRRRSGDAGAARGGAAAAVGAVGAAALASLCCMGPLVFVLFGVGAGLASTFEPLRPAFTVLTVGLLGLAFYTVYGKTSSAVQPSARSGETARGLDGSCAVPGTRRRHKVLLWAAAALTLLLLTFPAWSKILV